MSGSDEISDHSRDYIRAHLMGIITSGRKISLDLERSVFDLNNETGLKNALKAIASKSQPQSDAKQPVDGRSLVALPRVITFPYSRHSSYPELCHLVDVFKPKDVWPCTVDVTEWLDQGILSRRTQLPNKTSH